MSKQFIVTVADTDIYRADAGHLNGQTIAKFIRQELQSCGGHSLPGDWEQTLLDNVSVKSVKPPVSDTFVIQRKTTSAGLTTWQDDRVVGNETDGKRQLKEMASNWAGHCWSLRLLRRTVTVLAQRPC